MKMVCQIMIKALKINRIDQKKIIIIILWENSTDLSQLGFVTLNDTEFQIIHVALYATNVFIP